MRRGSGLLVLSLLVAGCGDGPPPLPAPVQVEFPRGEPVPYDGACFVSNSLPRMATGWSAQASAIVLAPCTRPSTSFEFPCAQFGPVPDVALTALDPAVLLATWDPLRDARMDGPYLLRPLLLDALAEGTGRFRFDTMDGGSSTFSYRVETPRSWRLGWLLHDAEPHPLEAPALPRAIASGGSVRIVTRLLDGAGAGLCGHPTAQAEASSSLAITPVGFPLSGGQPEEPGTIANGVLRVSAVAESPQANLRLTSGAVAIDLGLAVLPAAAITSVRAESVAPYDNASEILRGFAYLGTRVSWQGGGNGGRQAAWALWLRAFAGDDEVAGGPFLVENLSPGEATLVGPDGISGDRIETSEPVVGLVAPTGTVGRVTLRISAPGSVAPPLDLAVDVPAAPTF